MNNIIELNNIPSKPLPYISDEDAPKFNEGKGWSFSNIYSLVDLRNIYLLSINCLNKSLKNITFSINKGIEDEKNKWEERKVLEYLNALVNFKLLNADYSLRKKCFLGRNPTEQLSGDDILTFREIFFSYFRFKEMASWFISTECHKSLNNLSEKTITEISRPVFFLSNNNRFMDTLLYGLDEEKDYRYTVSESMKHQMRFWDVFLKWGTTLRIVDKFSLSVNRFKTAEKKELSIAYFIKTFEPFDLIEFIKTSDFFPSREIYIPDLIFELAFQFRFSVLELKNFIITQLEKNPNLTYERTSKIFIIKGKESIKKIDEATYLFPKMDDSFVSHLILRK